jgi:hypothetical protein
MKETQFQTTRRLNVGSTLPPLYKRCAACTSNCQHTGTLQLGRVVAPFCEACSGKREVPWDVGAGLALGAGKHLNLRPPPTLILLLKILPG